MADGRLETLHEVFRPKIVRIWTIIVGALFLWDVLCNQFNFPKLPRLWGMSGNLLPVWAWLVLLQLGVIYGLFEYVRRNAPARKSTAGELPVLDYTETDQLRSELRRLEAILDEHQRLLKSAVEAVSDVQKLSLGALDDLKGTKQELADHKEHMSACYSAQDAARTTGLTQLKDELEVVRHGCADLQDKINTLFLAFQALRTIGNEGRLANAVFSEYEFLIQRVSEKQSLKGEHFVEWKSRHTSFESAMEKWTSLARGWLPNVDQALREAESRDLTALKWDELDGLFEGSNAVITYKSFVVKFVNWSAFRPRLVTALNIAAFGGHDAAKQAREGGLAGMFGNDSGGSIGPG